MYSTISTHSHIWTASSVNAGRTTSRMTATPTTSFNLLSTTNNFFDYLHQHYPVGLKHFRAYERKLLAAHEDKARLFFLRECLQECVLPVSVPTGDNLLELAFSPQQRHALQDRITIQRLELGSKFQSSRQARIWYRSHIPSRFHDDLHRVAARYVDRHIAKFKHELSNKLHVLIEKSPWTTKTLTECVINLSSTDLSVDQI